MGMGEGNVSATFPGTSDVVIVCVHKVNVDENNFCRLQFYIANFVLNVVRKCICGGGEGNHSHVTGNCWWTVANKPIQSCVTENPSSLASNQIFIASLSGQIN